MAPPRPGRRRISLMPDTNIWNYIVDAQATKWLETTTKDAGVRVVACPAVLYESLRVANVERRKALIDAMSLSCWKRLMPEAFEEAEEVRQVIKARRPQWLIGNPDVRDWYALKRDWRSGLWRRARTKTSRVASDIDRLGGRTLERARAETADIRQELIKSRFRMEPARLGSFRR